MWVSVINRDLIITSLLVTHRHRPIEEASSIRKFFSVDEGWTNLEFIFHKWCITKWGGWMRHSVFSHFKTCTKHTLHTTKRNFIQNTDACSYYWIWYTCAKLRRACICVQLKNTYANIYLLILQLFLFLLLSILQFLLFGICVCHRYFSYRALYCRSRHFVCLHIVCYGILLRAL